MVYALTPAAEGDAWAEGLFDERARAARAAGAIDWRASAAFPEGGEVHHLVYSSGQTPAGEPHFTLRRRSGETTPIGVQYGPSGRDRLVAALQSEARSGPRPRLLVLHDVAAAVPAYLAADLVAAGLAAGADAVLAVSFAEEAADAGAFFPTFYRRILQNWPLDRCLQAALAASATAGALPGGWIMGLRQGGELRLLLTGTLVEARAALQPGVEPLWANDLSRRPARLVDDWRRDLTRGQAEEWQAVAHDVSAAGYDTTFDDQLAGLQRVVAARREMRAAETKGAIRERALEALAGATPAEVEQSAVRLTNLWLTRDAGGDQLVAADQALRVGERYRLRIAIGPRRVGALGAEAFPEEALSRAFEGRDRLSLQVVVFAPGRDFELPVRQAVLSLPRVGASDEAVLALTPLRAGRLRLRVAIYHRNVLLQSLQCQVDAADQASGAATPMCCLLDYVASPDLALLDELPAPAVTLFTNQAAEGTHWVGVYADAGAPGEDLASGRMRTFHGEDLARRAGELRGVLAAVEGDRTYSYDAPVFGPGAAADSGAAALTRREEYLLRLALAGWELYHHLFLADGDPDDRPARARFQEALAAPGIISVARCNREDATLPWAALYRLPLDEEAGPPGLCPVWRAQLAANVWGAAGDLAIVNDLLDDPQACRAQAECPLSGEAAATTVCPFGFWGMLHQMEQPLQQVTPTPPDEVPPELRRPGYSQEVRLRRDPGPLRLAMGVYLGLRDADQHCGEIKALVPGGELSVDCEDDRNRLLAMMRAGGWPIYYFYCHGVMHAGGSGIERFGLKLGTAGDPGYITAANIVPDEIPWVDRSRPEQMAPLVVLNACETLALTPEVINDLMSTLRTAGALGVVGTEIKVWTQLARPFGCRVLADLLAGRSMGEAFLAARRHLLRQLNPLGLAYTLNAPASLHLHTGEDCAWCKAHLPAAVPAYA